MNFYQITVQSMFGFKKLLKYTLRGKVKPEAISLPASSIRSAGKVSKRFPPDYSLQFAVNHFYFLFEIREVVAQTLHAAFHVTEHRTGIFRFCREEAHVVFIGVQL